ncbi:MAG: hypothetical protein ACLRP8_00030 [Roseburia intestinalis]
MKKGGYADRKETDRRLQMPLPQELGILTGSALQNCLPPAEQSRSGGEALLGAQNEKETWRCVG